MADRSQKATSLAGSSEMIAEGVAGAVARLVDTSTLPTLRDRFAMAALTGFMALEEYSDTPEEFARVAYVIADAMLEARK